MSDDYSDLRSSLNQSTDSFRLVLDASDLVDTSRVRSRRRRGIGIVVGTLAVVLAALIVVPSLTGRSPTVPAAPAPASADPSEAAPTIAPIRPSGDGTGSPGDKRFDSMATPLAGTVRPDGSWKAVTEVRANLRVQYPPSWTAFEEWGVIWIKAPSGYTLDILLDSSGKVCSGVPAVNEQQLAVTGLVATENVNRGEGPVVIRWQNGGEFPVSVNLAQRSTNGPCWEAYLNYGGVDNVYVGSADNTANPTRTELDEAVAILASASRVH